MRSTAVILRGLCVAAVLVLVTPAHAQRDPAAEAAQIAELLRLEPGAVVADVGAGGGTWTFDLARRVGRTGRVYATEVKDVQIEGLRLAVRARKVPNVEVVRGSQADMGLPATCCDALLLRLVYHAFDEPALMRESLRRAMKPGGLVLIVDFRPPPEQLTREMQEAGFDRLQFIERWQGQEGVYAVLFKKLAGREA